MVAEETLSGALPWPSVGRSGDPEQPISDEVDANRDLIIAVLQRIAATEAETFSARVSVPMPANTPSVVFVKA